MASRVVLISGVGRYLGASVAASLAAVPSIDRIVGIDTAPSAPTALDHTEYVRADIAHPLIGKILDQAEVTTVVHTNRAADPAGLRSLLRACEQSRTLTRFVLASTTAVYGASRRDPAVFTERTAAAAEVPPGAARAAEEAETSVRTFARRRPDIAVSVLRLAPLIGPSVDSRLTRYLAPRVVPVRIGFDPRLQLLHESDAIEVLCRAAIAHHPGIFNVAGDGVITLSQLLRRSGRLRLPLPAAALRLRRLDTGWLTHGRVVDTTTLKTRLGYVPQYSTTAALSSYLESRTSRPRLASAALAAAESVVAR
jgi:UDP-glucose 4-epimerase